MATMRELIARVRYWRRSRRHDADLAEEMAVHREMTERRLIEEGADPIEAARAAARALGNGLSAQHAARDVWIPAWFQDISQDVRFAARLLAKERWFTMAVVVALALGIGANTAVFTLVNAVNWRGLPVEQPQRIVAVYSFDPGGRRVGASFDDFKDWQRANQTFDGLAAITGTFVTIGDTERAPDRVMAAYVSWNTFRLLGDQPVQGRDFVEDDDREGAPAVVVLGYRIWRDRYGSDAGLIGRTIAVNGQPAIVIGVMADGFQFPALADAWQPLTQAPGVLTARRDARNLRIVGRLAANTGMSRATADVNAIASRLALAYPDTNAGVRATVEPFTGRADQPFLLAMFGAVAFVLLIACANVANLLLARASHRAREMTLRATLGASRWRVTRQLLVESLMLAMMAGGLGLVIAKLCMVLFVSDVDAGGIAYWVRWTMDGRVFGFLAAISAMTFLLFGVGPALFLSRGASAEVLKEGGRTSTSGLRARRSSTVLLVTELALTLVLLAGASLMTRSLLAMQANDLVIDSARLLTANVTPSPQKYPEPAQRLEFLRRLEERLRVIPVLASATLASSVPFVGAVSRRLAIDGRNQRTDVRQPVVLVVTVGARYFDTLGLPLLAGRPFTNVDGSAGHDSVIVNRAFAARFFPNLDPIGQRIRLTAPTEPAEKAEWMTIVGVSPTVRQQPQEQTVDAVAYVPFTSTLGSGFPSSISLIVRTDAEPAALTGTLREELRQLDADLAVSRIQPLEYYLRQSRWSHRLFSRVFGLFAGIAVVLSVIGLYAVTAYAVGQRTQEIGVRLALGAQRGQVVWLFVRQMAVRLAAGLVIGLAGAFGLGTLLQGLLVGTSPTDPVALVTSMLCLVFAAAAATLVPTRRATRLDPVAALRHE